MTPRHSFSSPLLALALLFPVVVNAGPHLQTSDIDPCASGYSRWNGVRFVCVPFAQAAPAPSIDALSPLIATAGATVTITGRFLSAIASVRIGTTNVTSFARVNDTTITFVVPAGATTGTVSVTDTAAQTATSLDSLTIQTGVITGITVTDASLPFGTAVQLTGSCTGSGTFDASVTWSLVPDPDGCGYLGARVTPQGLFTSPTAPQTCYPGNSICDSAGTCRAIAACTAQPSRTALATVVLAAAPAGSDFIVSPASAARSPGQTQVLTATGGTPPYTWGFTAIGSGTPLLSASTGSSVVYTAGVSTGTDVLQVVDSTLPNSLRLSVSINVTATPTVLAAFPGAEGGGAGSLGGRGGTIYRVTNLNDAGAGSLRACVEASGPRTCVFTTGGTITLASRLTVLNPYLTIAGQTAQGEGITLDGRNLTVSVMSIRTHNVIIRYLRVRKGYNAGTASQEGSALGLDATQWNNDVNNVVIDHVSASWGQDETLGAWTNTGASATRAVKNVTFSNNMAYEGLVPHQTIGPVGANEKAAADAMTDIDYIGNILANGGNRFPLFKGKSGTFANNVVYNWTWWATFVTDGATFDVVNNVYKRGPLSASSGSDSYAVIVGNPGCASCGATGAPSVYVSGNSYQGSVPGDQWAVASRVVTQVNGEGGHYCINDAGTVTEPTCFAVRNAWRRASTRTRTAGIDVTLKTAAQAETDALAAGGAGNSRRLNCDGTWTNFRDAVDTRIITQYNAGTGGSPTHEYDAGYTGFPSLAAGTPCTDTDTDGIPDTYETASCGTTTCLVPNTVQLSGYTNLEYYLAGLAIPAGGGGGGGSGTVELHAGPMTGSSAVAGLTVSTPITTTISNVMLVAVVDSEHGSQSHGALTVTSSGGLSCTSRAAVTYLNYVRSEIWTCWAASPGTYTVTGTFASGPDTLRRYLAVYAFAGASQTLGAAQTRSTGGGANEAQTITMTPTETGSFLVMGGSSGSTGASVTWLESTVGGLHWSGLGNSSLVTGRHGPTENTNAVTLGTSAPTNLTGVTSALEIVPAP